DYRVADLEDLGLPYGEAGEDASYRCDLGSGAQGRRVIDAAHRAVRLRRTVVEVDPEQCGGIGRGRRPAQVEKLVRLGLLVVNALQRADDAGIAGNEGEEQSALFCILDQPEYLLEIDRLRRLLAFDPG